MVVAGDELGIEGELWFSFHWELPCHYEGWWGQWEGKGIEGDRPFREGVGGFVAVDAAVGVHPVDLEAREPAKEGE